MTQEIHNAHGQPLDGTGNIKPTPFDSYDKKVRGEHVPTTATSPDPDPASLQEYPKAIAHDEKTGEPIIAKDAAHEAQLTAQAEENK